MATFFAGRSSRCSRRFLFFSDMVDMSVMDWGRWDVEVGGLASSSSLWSLPRAPKPSPRNFLDGTSAVEILARLASLRGSDGTWECFHKPRVAATVAGSP